MKQIYTLFLLLIFALSVHAQQLKIGDQVSNFSFELVNGSETELKDFKDKIIIIDFWATWCGACIVGMPHLSTLQTKYKDDLVVIALSHETKERVQRFYQNRPQNFKLGIDIKEQFANAFPHRIIPHTVLIDRQGKVLAITQPENITHEIIEKAISGETVDLPLKEENTQFDMYSDYFKRDTTIVEYFVIQPGNPDVPSFTVKYAQGVFGKRRISMLNTTIPGMYRQAYQKSAYRLIYDLDESQFSYNNPKNKFMMDVIVASDKKDDIEIVLQEKLSEALDFRVRLDSIEMDVVILSKHDSTSFELRKTDEHVGFSGRGDGFKSEGANLNDLSTYLENFGIVGMPVVNETGIEGTYKIDFSFSPEKKGDLQTQLKAIGLSIKKGKRKIEVLRIGNNL